VRAFYFSSVRKLMTDRLSDQHRLGLFLSQGWRGGKCHDITGRDCCYRRGS
jgi:hypothetical protein